MTVPTDRSALFRPLLFLLLCLALALLSGCGKQSVRSPVQAQRSYTSTSAAIAQTALTQVGRPYVTGGASPRGFDCSGLVFWSYGRHGVKVPRLSKDQASAGSKVGRANLRPGDIVVFRIPRSGYHTGIYTGKNNFVHSPKPRAKVRVESLNTSYWRRYYVSGRRIVRR